MNRLLLLLTALSLGCAELPEIQPCAANGRLLEPTYLNLGNDDLMVASLQYVGCEDYHFRLCGVGDPWITEEVVTLGIWYDEAVLGTCSDEVQVDQLFSLRAVRERYEDQFDVDAAELVLDITGQRLDYSFAPPE